MLFLERLHLLLELLLGLLQLGHMPRDQGLDLVGVLVLLLVELLLHLSLGLLGHLQRIRLGLLQGGRVLGAQLVQLGGVGLNQLLGRRLSCHRGVFIGCLLLPLQLGPVLLGLVLQLLRQLFLLQGQLFGCGLALLERLALFLQPGLSSLQLLAGLLELRLQITARLAQGLLVLGLERLELLLVRGLHLFQVVGLLHHPAAQLLQLGRRPGGLLPKSRLRSVMLLGEFVQPGLVLFLEPGQFLAGLVQPGLYLGHPPLTALLELVHLGVRLLRLLLGLLKPLLEGVFLVLLARLVLLQRLHLLPAGDHLHLHAEELVVHLPDLALQSPHLVLLVQNLALLGVQVVLEIEDLVFLLADHPPHVEQLPVPGLALLRGRRLGRRDLLLAQAMVLLLQIGDPLLQLFLHAGGALLLLGEGRLEPDGVLLQLGHSLVPGGEGLLGLLLPGGQLGAQLADLLFQLGNLLAAPAARGRRLFQLNLHVLVARHWLLDRRLHLGGTIRRALLQLQAQVVSGVHDHLDHRLLFGSLRGGLIHGLHHDLDGLLGGSKVSGQGAVRVHHVTVVGEHAERLLCGRGDLVHLHVAGGFVVLLKVLLLAAGVGYDELPGLRTVWIHIIADLVGQVERRQAEQAVHLGEQLFDLERLEQVILRPGAQLAVLGERLLSGFRGHDDQRDPLELRVLLQPVADGVPILVRQLHTEQDQIRRVAPGLVQAVTAVTGDLHGEVVSSQLISNVLGEVEIALDEKDAALLLHCLSLS